MTENTGFYLYKKEVDWSLLSQGLSIPSSIQVIFHKLVRDTFPRGTIKDINLILDNTVYKAKLINQNFNEKKYPNHGDILQIRYSSNSELVEKLRKIFFISYSYIKSARMEQEGDQRKFTRVPEEMREYAILYTTSVQDTFLLDYITSEDSKEISSFLSTVSEEEFELDTNYSKIDLQAGIEHRTQVIKVRRLDKSIAENLKLLYEYQCQICNLNFGKIYDSNIIEAHHIEPFITSLNNDSTNIIIICPNHHRVIHKAIPTFDRSNLTFVYQNGLKETIKLNKHL